MEEKDPGVAHTIMLIFIILLGIGIYFSSWDKGFENGVYCSKVCGPNNTHLKECKDEIYGRF